MMNLKDLTTAQLQRALEIKQQIENLQGELESIEGGRGRGPGRPKGSRKMSAAGRAAIAEAAKERWAKYRGEKPLAAKAPGKKRRKMSAAAKAKIAAAAKARWAKAKAAGKKTL